jgi:hypothetical protein
MFLFIMTLFTAQAQENNDIQYERQTEIDFEALELSGELVKPQGALIIERTNIRFNPLIELRMDFDPEMASSINLIK